MDSHSHWLAAASVWMVLVGLADAQVNSNDTPLNNNGDVIFIYSSPSSGFTSLAFPPGRHPATCTGEPTAAAT